MGDLRSVSERVDEWLRARGHDVTGVGDCEKCWSGAASLYVDGRTYPSHYEAYVAVCEKAEADALSAVRAAAVSEVPA